MVQNTAVFCILILLGGCSSLEPSIQDTHLPSLANLILDDDHFCTGIILRHLRILTAGTCCSCQNPEDMSVRVGGHDDFLVAYMWLHPSFDVLSHENNVCLLELTDDIWFDENALPATLPPVDAEYPGGTQCVETGWQDDQEGSWSVTIMSDAACGFGPYFCGSMDVNAGDPRKLNSGI